MTSARADGAESPTSGLAPLSIERREPRPDDIEILDIRDINSAYDRVQCRDVKYRFVIDMPTLKAALQFSAAHPAVAAIIPGAKNPGRIPQNIELMNASMPDLRAEMKTEGLLPADAHTPA